MTSSKHAEFIHKCVLKMAKWSNRAEDATSFKEASKALRKYAKWSTLLAEYERAIERYSDYD